MNNSQNGLPSASEIPLLKAMQILHCFDELIYIVIVSLDLFCNSGVIDSYYSYII